MDEGYNVYNIEPKFKDFLRAENISADTLKNYLSDIRHFLGWLSYNKLLDKTFEKINSTHILQYKSYLESSKVPVITINRRLSTLRKFFTFLHRENPVQVNPAKEVPNIKIESKINVIKNHFKKNKKRSSANNAPILDIPSKEPFATPAIRIPTNAWIMIVIVAFILMIYKNKALFLNKQSSNKSSFNQINQIKKGRTLSFRGKILDSLGNPITSKTDATFRLYTSEKNGQSLYEGSCKGVNGITPDTTGFINIAIGKDCSMGSIPATVFTDNASLYLGITIGSDKELSPRQQIANAAYALDAEKLQGLDLGVTPGSVPYINNDGNIYIEALQSSIRATDPEGTFTLGSENNLTLESGEQGDIIMQTGAFGSLKFKIGGFEDSISSLFIGTDGNVGIGTEDPSEFKVQVAGDIGPEIGDVFNLGSETSQWSNIYASKFLQNGVPLCDKEGNNCPTNISAWTLSSPYLYTNEANIKVGIGTTNTAAIISKLFVTKDPSEVGTGKALAIFDQTENQDIITASASGTTRFVVKNNGNTGIGTYNPSTRLDVSGGQTKIEVSTQYTERLCHSGTDGSVTQNVVLGDCYAGGADLAEYYGSDDTLEAGDVVIAKEGAKMIGKDSKAYVNKSQIAYDTRVIGIVSTNPYDVFGKNYNKDEKHYPIALNGRVPVKIAADSADIKAGDLLTTSSQPGKAMKATNAGQIIGKALENWSQNQIKNEILVFVNISWADPNATIASDGTLKAPSSGINPNKFIYSGLLDKSTDDNRLIENMVLRALDSEKNRLYSYWQKTGLSAQEGLSDFNLAYKDAEKALSELTLKIRTLIVKEKIISPVIETTDIIASGSAILGQIQTSEIKSSNSTLTIDISNNISTAEAKGPLAELIIRGREGKKAASIDDLGNATFSGTLTAESASVSGTLIADSIATNKIDSSSLAVSDATISGTLIADDIQSNTIRALEQRINSLAEISKQNNSLLASQSSTIADASSSATIASNSENDLNLNEIQKLIAQLKNNALPDPAYYHAPTDLSSLTESSKLLTENQKRLTSVDTLSNFEDITVTGAANFYKMNIAESATIGTLILENNSILSLADNLNFSALSSITLFDGAVTIARDGTMTSNGQIIARSGVKTNTIEAMDNNVTVKLSTATSTSDSTVNPGKLIVANAAGDTMASIDASGSAEFTDISLSKYMGATDSASLISAKENFQKNGIFAPAFNTERKTAGNGIIPENSAEVLIYNDKINSDSLVYLTPTEQLFEGQLSIIKKESCDAGIADCKPYFKVGISKAEHPQVSFNWLIIN